MNKNRVLTLLVSSIFILSVVGCSSATPAASPPGTPLKIIASEDYPSYGSVDALSERADTIVKGNVIQTRVEALDDRGQADSQDQNHMNAAGSAADAQVSFDKIYTIYTVQVTESYKGVTQPGIGLKSNSLADNWATPKSSTMTVLSLCRPRIMYFFLKHMRTPLQAC